VDDYSRQQLGSRYVSAAEAAELAYEEGDEYLDEGLDAAADFDPGDEMPPLPADGAEPVVAAPPARPIGPSELPYPQPVFYWGRGEPAEDPHYTFINTQFNPLGYGSLSYWSDDAFASGLVERRWKLLDPAFRNRIWLRSLYPYPRVEEGSKEVAGVIAASGLGSRYKNIGHTFELVARAATTGKHDDVQVFLLAYRKCIGEGRCEGHDFYERAATAVHDVYSVPAAQLLVKGHCARAVYLNAIGLRMIRAIDPPRFAARATVNRMYMLSAIAEQEQCPAQRAAVSRAVNDELFGDPAELAEPVASVSPLFRASAWRGRVPNLYHYTQASAQLRAHDYAAALASLRAIRQRPGQTLQDMTSLMRVRALFEQARARPTSAVAALPDMQSIVTAMRPSSLRTDAGEYVTDLQAELSREAVAINPPAAPAGGAP
jgi:hypothetical protein